VNVCFSQLFPRPVTCTPAASGWMRPQALVNITVASGRSFIVVARNGQRSGTCRSFLRPATRLRGAGSQQASRALARTSHPQTTSDALWFEHLPGARKLSTGPADSRCQMSQMLADRTEPWALAIAAVHFGQRRLPSAAEFTEPLDSCAARSHGPQNFRILARIQHVARLGSRFCLEARLGRLCLDGGATGGGGIKCVDIESFRSCKTHFRRADFLAQDRL
jgi:hypothetical protein